MEKKSDFFPEHKIFHLGFVLDSVSMTVSCPSDKIVRLQFMCWYIMQAGIVTVHDAKHIPGSSPLWHIGEIAYIPF